MAIFNSYSTLNYQRVVVEPSTTLDLSCINSTRPQAAAPAGPVGMVGPQLEGQPAPGARLVSWVAGAMVPCPS